MSVHTVKCDAGCGGVLRHYEEMSPTTWGHNVNDPEVITIDGKSTIRCPVCGRDNVVELPQVQGVIRVTGLDD
jgi:hypothetical protein